MSGGSSVQYDFETDVGGLGGEVTLSDLFPPAWMRDHTEAESIMQFVDDSTFEVTTAEEFHDLPDERWSEYVAANSEFDGWGQMLACALDAYIARRAEARDARPDADERPATLDR